MTEQEKMLSGEIYDASAPELVELRQRAHKLSKEYNFTEDTETDKRQIILKSLFPNAGKELYLQSPIQFDYGKFTTFGDRCYANFHFTVLDSAPVTIGNDVFFGPNCTIATPMHPFNAEERRMKRHENGELYNLEYAKPVIIGDDCWIASNVTICGGVTIGKGSIIGAGSVVTRDIPENVLAAGNPCRVIRTITEQDKKP